MRTYDGESSPQPPIKPQIAVIGAGAIGSLVGGMLAHHGEDILLVGSQEHIEATRRDGLKVDGVQGAFTVPVKAARHLDARPDIVIITVKSQDVAATCQAIQPWASDIPVVMTQNGLAGAETAASFFNRENIISAIFMLNARFMEAGRVTYVKPGAVVLGNAFVPNGHGTKQIQSLLAKGFKTKISDDIQGVQWTKLFVNALGNALDGLTGMAMGEYQKYPAMWRIGTLILKEAQDLIDQAQIRMAPLPGIPMAWLKLMLRLPLPLAARVLKLVTTIKGDKQIMTSTLQSLLKGKKSEVDYLHGEFVRLGRRLGVPTPVNSKVVELIHANEGTGRFFSPDELAQIFGV